MKKKMLIIWVVSLAVFLIFGFLTSRFFMLGKQSQVMDFQSLDGSSSQLKLCGDKPNCVCSCNDPKDEKHFIASLQGFTLTGIKQFLQSQKGYQLIQENPNYLYFQFKSAIFGFVDDLEFLIADKNSNQIQVRSASRVGYSDLGANRKRIEWIRKNGNTK